MGQNMTLQHEKITSEIIRAFYEVYNTLGYGFLEKVYENALKYELDMTGLKVVTQMPIEVKYKGVHVGEYFADMCVEDKIVVELKSAERLSRAHEAQLLNYLKGTEIEVGLLLNFGMQPEFARKILTR